MTPPRISADSLITTIWGKRDRSELVALVEARDVEIAEQAAAPLMAELTAYRDAAQYDAMMSGPLFRSWNRSQLDRARAITEAAIRARQEPKP